MYRISGSPFANANNTLASEGITEGDWARYSEVDLVTHINGGNGSWCWCQEASGAHRVFRGQQGASYLSWSLASNAGTYSGWRPCLELVE